MEKENWMVYKSKLYYTYYTTHTQHDTEPLPLLTKSRKKHIHTHTLKHTAKQTHAAAAQ